LHELCSYVTFVSTMVQTANDDCAIYLLDVPEFAALVAELRATPGVSLAKRGDYYVAQAPGEIVLRRAATGVGQAVWFGALTGGVRGRIVEFSENELRVAPLTPHQ
jgi:hypothetical protein